MEGQVPQCHDTSRSAIESAPQPDGMSTMWRRYSGFIAWPTLVLMGGVVSTWSAAVVGHATGVLSTLAAAALSFLACYAALTPAHEAAHGNISGRKHPWLDSAVGWVAMFILLGPFPPFRELHLRHHSHTNHPTKDPDMWISGKSILLVFKFLTILPKYYWSYSFPPPGVRSELVRTRHHAVGFFLAYAALMIVMALAGLVSTAIFVMIVPAWLALSVLAVVFDWLPHHPHLHQQPFRNARVILGPVLDRVLLGQNFHLVHHLWPAVPWYRYSSLFRDTEPGLRAKGAIVIASILEISDRHVSAPPSGDET